MSKSETWRWADPNGQQRRVRFDELRAALAGGVIAPNTPVWKPGWPAWQPAHEVPELSTSALSAANGVVPNIPPPPLAVVAVQQEFEAQATGGKQPSMYEEPPPPPHYIPAPAKSGSLAPPPPAVMPPSDLGSDRGLSAQPGTLGKSLPTAIGIPPPPEMAQMAGGLPGTPVASKPPPPMPGALGDDDLIEEVSGSMLVDESKGQLVAAGGIGGMPPPTDPVLRADAGGGATGEFAGMPMRRPGLSLIINDLKEIRAGRPPKNKLLIAVLGVVGLSGVIMILAVIISAVSGGSSDASAAGSASATASETDSPPELTSAEPAAPPTPANTAAVPAAVQEPPKAAATELGDCIIAGPSRVLARRALIVTGIEAVPGQSELALGFASSLHDAIGVALDPGSLTPTATVRARAPGDIRHVVPFFSGGKLVIVPDAERRGDRVASRRFVATSNPVDVGVLDNAIVWAPHGKDSVAKLFSLDGGDGPVEALRAIPLSSGKGIALAFRRGNQILVGVATGDGVLDAQGELSRINGLGQVGSPALASSGDSIVVAWADREGKEDTWGIRWTKRSISGAINEPRALVLPEGGLGGMSMSPSVAALGGGKFLLAWTEGPVSSHQVRALTFNRDGVPSGSPLDLSASGVNAGQPAATVGVDGRGVVAFLAPKGKANEVMATPISCPAR